MQSIGRFFIYTSAKCASGLGWHRLPTIILLGILGFQMRYFRYCLLGTKLYSGIQPDFLSSKNNLFHCYICFTFNTLKATLEKQTSYTDSDGLFVLVEIFKDIFTSFIKICNM